MSASGRLLYAIIINDNSEYILDWYSDLDTARHDLERYRNRAEPGVDIFLFEMRRLPG
jgi:hypothetical protein